MVISCVSTIAIPSVDEDVEKVTTSGGLNIVTEMAIPSVGWLAYCKDTEGNIFGITQPNAAAR